MVIRYDGVCNQFIEFEEEHSEGELSQNKSQVAGIRRITQGNNTEVI